ncbi:MAG TPA: glycoside hydrolase family 15 protein [Gemmatimonadales bacterium]|jgi:GH15 family glucan-1,4-alpha-glucosidase
MTSLDLALIGNGTVGALIDPRGEICWTCFPRFDGDPMFCSLLDVRTPDRNFGYATVDLLDFDHQEQHYLENTPILVTRLYDSRGACVEITDLAPRFDQHGRVFCPMMLVRRICRIEGTPRIRLIVRPATGYGERRTDVTNGSHHIRYIGDSVVLRLTTDASITALLEETPFFLENTITLMIGPDETLQGSVSEQGYRFVENTTEHWREWVRNLAIPFEWQEAVIRAAITLKLNTCEDTGAIVAAMTTSIPEAAHTQRNWDYRYCWLRDAYFVIHALNRLGATRTMERYMRWIANVIASTPGGNLEPVYNISGGPVPDERVITTLPGYRGMGPVRVGNEAHEQVQHDVFGSAILAATHMFFDRRLAHRGDTVLFHHLEALGERAAALFDQPDAGIWEFRGIARVHTFSSVMCWAACDRLARIAAHLQLADRADYWRERADRIHAEISARSWNESIGSLVSVLDGDRLDASLLHLTDVSFVAEDDPRFAATVRTIDRVLRRGDFLLRYDERDDFGYMDNAFLVCTFWYINALAVIGERQRARELFEVVLARRNQHGLFAEDIDPRTGEQWGNFVQTYSMVGLINCALRLSIPWDEAM